MAHFINSARFVRTKEDPDVDYLKHEGIGGVLSDALAELYQEQPEQPLTFLGNWLINYAASTDNLAVQKLLEDEREQLRSEFVQKQASAAEAQRILEQATEAAQAEEASFRTALETTCDAEAYLSQLVQQLQTATQATAAYIGKYEQVKKAITDLDDEQAHVNPDAPYVVRYIESTEPSILDVVLTEEEGEVTYSVWKEDAEEEQKSEHGGDTARENKPETLKIAFVPDVVNDSRIKFFDVPKLGCYLAIPLTYKSCLSENAFDAAVENTRECQRLRAEREEELQRLAQAAAEAAAEAEAKEEAKEEGEAEQSPEEPQLEEIKEAPYATQDVRFVVCLDSLGQDRVFTPEQVKCCTDWVTFFRDQWERAERDCMQHDVLASIKKQDSDVQTITNKEAEWAEEEKSALEEAENSSEEARKPLMAQAALFQVLQKRLLAEFNNLLAFKDFSFVKYPQVFKVAFLCIGLSKEQIVEPGTNRTLWKLAKQQLNESLKQAIADLNPRGPRSAAVPAYAKTMHLIRELEKVSVEEVRQFSLVMSLLYRFVEAALKLRVADVTDRRKAFLARQEAREAAIKAGKDLEAKRKRALDEALDKHKADMEQVEEGQREEFNQADFLAEFDERESNHAVQIPDEEQPDEDLDLDWEDTN